MFGLPLYNDAYAIDAYCKKVGYSLVNCFIVKQFLLKRISLQVEKLTQEQSINILASTPARNTDCSDNPRNTTPSDSGDNPRNTTPADNPTSSTNIPCDSTPLGSAWDSNPSDSADNPWEFTPSCYAGVVDPLKELGLVLPNIKRNKLQFLLDISFNKIDVSNLFLDGDFSVYFLTTFMRLSLMSDMTKRITIDEYDENYADILFYVN